MMVEYNCDGSIIWVVGGHRECDTKNSGDVLVSKNMGE